MNNIDKIMTEINQFKIINNCEPSIIYCPILLFDKLKRESKNLFKEHNIKHFTIFGIHIEPLEQIMTDTLIILNKVEHEGIIYSKKIAQNYINVSANKIQSQHIIKTSSDTKLFVLEYERSFFDKKDEWKLTNIKIFSR